MRILAVSDIHDEELILQKLKAYYEKESFDYVFIAGDTTNKSLSFVEDTLSIFKNAFIIPGNNEPKEVIDALYAKKGFAHERRAKIEDGYNIVGFGYSNITPFGTVSELSEEEIYSRMSKLEIDRNTLLLCHCPPKGIFDYVRGKNVGSKAILKIIEEKKPFALFCGHVHELDGMMKHGETMVVKIPAANRQKVCLINIKDKNIDARFVDI